MADSPSPLPPYSNVWTKRAVDADEWLRQHKVVVSATSASVISTFAGFPLDSLKSRLQSSREKVSIPRLAAEVVREEGIGGLWRGFPLPLITISIVRTISFTIYSSTKRILNSTPSHGGPPKSDHKLTDDDRFGSKDGSGEKNAWINIHLGWFSGDNAKDIGITSLLAGAASGAVVCVGSAPFELVKVRRQLEYQIYRDSHPELFLSPSAATAGSGSKAAGVPRAPSFTPPTTLQAVKLIVNSNGLLGLYTGWRLHFVRDTLGTALYFAEYDVMRYYLGRQKTNTKEDGAGRGFGHDVQGDVPDWAKAWLPRQAIPFLCGSVAGVSSWALIYPVDAIKTKAQQRALSGLTPRTPAEQFHRLVRGTGRDCPKPLLSGIARLYRGLGISMIRSMLTHGLLWTLLDAVGSYIETKPCERYFGVDIPL
ncbi:hypothetical protein AYX14_04173 [Cryptococcus neoformans]|nr:hypothetical protein AYX15_03354 [Cryptococcus neoformans var. grubii]OWZ70418.1 hypothetical protein AYX14_04173 [Cryptococcus neoformans var. grubii]OWZ77145.1 hypothetical protein C365_04404 [Cryptococcus neoformans var. grubii Bt85]OXG14648.1 hypothetical protein C366_04691 [Cryptococcus neoformans var. grubii Tu401-1]OXM77735.1 hypothetical protein C364_04675 [Cryptococcus neoformans var. grubii Bt63]